MLSVVWLFQPMCNIALNLSCIWVAVMLMQGISFIGASTKRKKSSKRDLSATRVLYFVDFSNPSF